MHFGAPERGVFPLVSMLGDLVPLVAGAALAFKRRGQPRVAMTFLGEGAFSVGDTHEGLNLAAVWQVPAVFVIQANRYSYSTPVSRQMVNTNITQRIFGGWSIPGERVDGTDALAVLEKVRGAVERARAGQGPQSVEALTVRMHGHAAHDDARYMPAMLREEFFERFDPVERLGARLALDGFGSNEIERIRESAADEVAAGLAEAEQAPAPDPATLEQGVYAAPPGLLRRHRQQPSQKQVDENLPRARRAPVVRPPEVAVRAVDGVDENRRRLLDLDPPDRAVGDPVREQPLDRVDVSLARAHLLIRLMEETPVRLLVQRGEEREVILRDGAHGRRASPPVARPPSRGSSPTARGQPGTHPRSHARAARRSRPGRARADGASCAIPPPPRRSGSASRTASQPWRSRGERRRRPAARCSRPVPSRVGR